MSAANQSPLPRAGEVVREAAGEGAEPSWAGVFRKDLPLRSLYSLPPKQAREASDSLRSSLKAVLIAALAALSVTLGACATSSQGGLIGQPAPAFSLPALSPAPSEGRSPSSDPSEELVVLAAPPAGPQGPATLPITVVDFWASWCGPCREELPELQRLAAEYAPRGVRFLTVNLDSDLDAARDLARRLGLTLPVALDTDKRVANAYRLPTMPTSVVIDRSGRVRHVHAGFAGSSDIARFHRELDALLAE